MLHSRNYFFRCSCFLCLNSLHSLLHRSTHCLKAKAGQYVNYNPLWKQDPYQHYYTSPNRNPNPNCNPNHKYLPHYLYWLLSPLLQLCKVSRSVLSFILFTSATIVFSNNKGFNHSPVASTSIDPAFTKGCNSYLGIKICFFDHTFPVVCEMSLQTYSIKIGSFRHALVAFVVPNTFIFTILLIAFKKEHVYFNEIQFLEWIKFSPLLQDEFILKFFQICYQSININVLLLLLLLPNQFLKKD